MPPQLHTISLRHALDGLVYALSTQPNFKVHLIISLVVIFMGVLFRLTDSEWLILTLTLTSGLVVELINTAIETAVDLVTDKFHPLAKIAKDVSASAMLLYAVGSSIIGLIIFVPKIIEYWTLNIGH